MPIFQWYSCSSRAAARPGFTFPWLPADGWIIDEYTAVPSDFEEQVRRYRLLGLPLIQLGYATPNEALIFHPNILLGQLRVAKKYNVPFAFYGWEGWRKRTHIWDESAEESSKKVFKLVLDQVQKVKKVSEKDLLDWDVINKPMETPLPKVGVFDNFGVRYFREDFDLRMTLYDKVSRHDFMDRSLIRGLRNMKWMPDPARIVIRACDDGPVDASIANYWTAPVADLCRFSATAKIKIEPGASVEVVFEVSANGYDWVARTTEIDDGLIKIELPKAKNELYTRLRIAGKPAKSSTVLAAIDWIEVQATITNHVILEYK